MLIIDFWSYLIPRMLNSVSGVTLSNDFEYVTEWKDWWILINLSVFANYSNLFITIVPGRMLSIDLQNLWCELWLNICTYYGNICSSFNINMLNSYSIWRVHVIQFCFRIYWLGTNLKEIDFLWNILIVLDRNAVHFKCSFDFFYANH